MIKGPFTLLLSTSAKEQIQAIMDNPTHSGLQKQLKKSFRFLSQDPSYPGLSSHPMPQFDGIFGGKVFSSYVQNNTPQAHRILWVYGPKEKQITIVAIMSHY